MLIANPQGKILMLIEKTGTNFGKSVKETSKLSSVRRNDIKYKIEHCFRNVHCEELLLLVRNWAQNLQSWNTTVELILVKLRHQAL